MNGVLIHERIMSSVQFYMTNWQSEYFRSFWDFLMLVSIWLVQFKADDLGLVKVLSKSED